jgi:hypothetical protein
VRHPVLDIAPRSLHHGDQITKSRFARQFGIGRPAANVAARSTRGDGGESTGDAQPISVAVAVTAASGSAPTWAISIALLLSAALLDAQPAPDLPSLQPIRVDQPPKIEWFVGPPNGISNERGAGVTDFRQREPGDGTPVSQSTTAYLSYDDDHLYVVFVCRDDPAAIRANIARREAVAGDDAVAVYLDTFHDRERAYMFMVNPLGIQLDGILTEGQSDDYSFDAVWDSEGRLTADGYVVRLAIPFRSLRFPRRRQQSWGIALARLIRRNNEQAYWPHLTRRVQGFVPQFAAIDGLLDVLPGRNIDVSPYGVLAQARLRDGADRFETSGERRMGVDAKVVIRNALSLDATVNPDFSQVESDDPQVTVNERFEVFFPEKRPFFLENAAFFQTPINLFFSRRIVDPELGARTTGKLGRWAVGAIAIDDRDAGRLSADDPLAGRRAGIGAVRLQREVGEESTIGLLVTDREFAGRSDRVFGIDTRWKLNRNWAAAAQLARSDNRAPDGTRSGTGAFAEIQHDGRHLDYSGRYAGFTPAFAAPLGFVHRVGFHEIEQQSEYKWRPDRGSVVSFGPAMSALVNWDRTGRLQDRELAGSFRVELTRKTEVELARVEALERFAGVVFRNHANTLSVDTEWCRWLGGEAAYSWGTAVNHDPAPGLAPFQGRATDAEISVTVRPGPRLRLDQAYVASALESDGSRVFTEQRLRTRITYQFSRFLSVRGIVDEQVVTPNVALTDEEHERRLGGDVLLTYLVNPGTAVYVGYIDRYEDIEIAPDGRSRLGQIERPRTSVARQAFVKISYLWRF